MAVENPTRIKRCTKCKQSFPNPEDHFHRNRSQSDGLATECKPCVILFQREYRKHHKAEYNEWKKAWKRRNPERERVQSLRKRERKRQAFRRLCATIYRAWRAADPEQLEQISWELTGHKWLSARQSSALYRAKLKNAHVEPVDYGAVLGRDGFTCYLCGVKVTPMSVSFDHIIPLSRGGTHSEGNIRVAHRRCNAVKWNRPLSVALLMLKRRRGNSKTNFQT